MQWLTFFMSFTVLTIISGVVSYFLDLNFFIVWGIAMAGVLINGFVAEVEDNSDGGFNKSTNKRDDA